MSLDWFCFFANVWTVKKRRGGRLAKNTSSNSGTVIINCNVIMIVIILGIPSIILLTLRITSLTVAGLFVSVHSTVIIRFLLICMDV